MDPNVVASSDFSQIFRTRLPGNFNNMAAEQIFASPLVYTGNDGVQYVYVATTQNNIYKLDAKTGAIVQSRNLHVPFLQVELESKLRQPTWDLPRTKLTIIRLRRHKPVDRHNGDRGNRPKHRNLVCYSEDIRRAIPGWQLLTKQPPRKAQR